MLGDLLSFSLVYGYLQKYIESALCVRIGARIGNSFHGFRPLLVHAVVILEIKFELDRNFCNEVAERRRSLEPLWFRDMTESITGDFPSERDSFPSVYQLFLDSLVPTDTTVCEGEFLHRRASFFSSVGQVDCFGTDVSLVSAVGTSTLFLFSFFQLWEHLTVGSFSLQSLSPLSREEDERISLFLRSLERMVVRR